MSQLTLLNSESTRNQEKNNVDKMFIAIIIVFKILEYAKYTKLNTFKI
jgi:hypothetical protein